MTDQREMADQREMTYQREWWEEEPPNELNGLPKHIREKLLANHIMTIDEVRNAGPKRLMEIDGMGSRAVQRVKEWLRAQLHQPSQP